MTMRSTPYYSSRMAILAILCNSILPRFAVVGFRLGSGAVIRKGPLFPSVLVDDWMRARDRTRNHALSAAAAVSSSGTTSTPSDLSQLRIPRAAVSVVVQCHMVHDNNDNDDESCGYYYLLVQRGRAPNQGVWSFPGGKLEYGESAVAGGVRELSEETIWKNPADWQALQWYNGTLCTSDSIAQGYHYLIAQCFAELIVTDRQALPELEPADDAAAVAWFTRTEVQVMCDSLNATPGVAHVLSRVEALSKHGLLPTDKRVC
jgi:8-oxo-dGTP diphosphatase